MASNLFLGIDTSCYTTSVSIIDENKTIFRDERIILSVEEGKKGLRQSEAFFQHVKNMPILYNKATKSIDPSRIKGICVSSRPRDVEGSYMPVFMAGESFAQVISDSLKVPLYRLSHQENHILSVLIDYQIEDFKSFNAIHISGGTTEVLSVNYDIDNVSLDIGTIGNTLDISFGQLIDRVGITLGFHFPCGKSMDAYLKSSKINEQGFKLDFNYAFKENNFNISGIENKLINYYNDNKDMPGIKAFVIKSLFDYLGKLLEKIILKGFAINSRKQFLLVGGVAANTIIRSYLNNSKKLRSFDIVFGSDLLSTDNSVGCSHMALLNYIRE